MAGIAYNAAQVAGPVTGVGDLFDPRYKGRVTMLSDLRDGLGMVMQYQGHSPAAATAATVALAVNRVRVAAQSGQIARFTGNADFADLVSGQMAMAQVRSGDVAGLRAANRNLRVRGARWPDRPCSPATWSCPPARATRWRPSRG